MRRRLVSYFSRKRCPAAEDLADETLNRVARRLEEEGLIPDAPARYCYIVARFVFLESLRVPAHAPLIPSLDAAPAAGDAADEAGPLDCLDRCLEELPDADRVLILEYYAGEQRAKIERRRSLASRLGITANALSIRACRIRDRLEACVAGCLAKG